jgi:hypothetical protein
MLIRYLFDRRNSQSPQARRATALKLIVLAMIIQSVGLLWPRLPLLAAHFSPDVNDLLRGLCLGLAIGMCLVALVVIRRARCTGADQTAGQ